MECPITSELFENMTERSKEAKETLVLGKEFLVSVKMIAQRA